MVESKRVPPPPVVARSTPRRRLSPAPRPRAKTDEVEIELGESAIMSIEHIAPPALVMELQVEDLQVDEPVAAPTAPSTAPAPAPASQMASKTTPDEDELGWSAAIAKARSAPPCTSEPERPSVSIGMSDAMRAIEALSTIEPTPPQNSQSDIAPFAGDTFASDGIPSFAARGFTPARIGLISAAASALLIAAVHLMSASNASAQPELASEAPVRVIHAAAPFNEVTDQPDSSKGDKAQDYSVIDNGRARKLGTLGMRALNGGRLAAAKRIFDKALLANPRCRLALEGLGQHALRRHRYAEAAKYLEQAVKIDPRRADNRRYLGDAYAGQGRTNRARRQYTKAAEHGDTKASERLASL
ncbi:MAG: tetratricopeptide repeat protein [Nannocystaceae bacterium]|nr:tetratricopeptide repeat protein [Nannocystaceae bacterium]